MEPLILYFGSLTLFSFVASAWLAIYKYKRFPFKEFADYEWCPFWKEIQYDMGLITEYNIYFNGKPRVIYNSQPTNILDIGSGSGVTSNIILKEVFGNVSITLSDIHPNIESWKNLDVSYIQKPIRRLDMFGYSMISLINSLHHMDKGEFKTLLSKAPSYFIMDAKRLSPLHPLLIPNVYYLIYLGLTIRGIIKRGDYKLKSLLQIIVEPWIMCMDQMIGSMRRYHTDIIKEIAYENSYDVIISEDSLMNYIILEA
jgi:hypothetical protein